MHRYTVATGALVLAIAGLSAGGLAEAADTAGPKEPVAANQAVVTDVSGQEEFQRYCALCHGSDGRGTGPLTDADAMKKSAADLTQIAKNNGGVFPFSKVADTIRDGGGVAGHSPSRMLAWGKIFGAESDPVKAKAIIMEVTRYVEGLQEK
jgi:mono/diheme cytochrome c family protein